MAKIYRVTLTSEEQNLLEAILNNNSQTTARSKRCYALLATDENGEKQWNDHQIQKCYGLSIPTIERLRKRFVEGGLDVALYGVKKEIEREKIFDGRVESNLIALRCGKVPSGHSSWSLRLLADKMVEMNYVESISHESVRRILKKTKLNRGGLKVG